jgi:hypothetical protein
MRPSPDDSAVSDRDSFRCSIRSFLQSAESSLPTNYPIPHLVTEFGFQKRRLYDVLSVLAAVGCCQKVSSDSVVWLGLWNVPRTLQSIQIECGADSPIATLDQVVESQSSVSISKLTVGFVLCFLAMRQQTLDIKHISRYLSRRTGRHKSTLCKLYQIAHILEAAGIIAKGTVPGQLAITPKFFCLVDLRIPDGPNPFAIGAILNQKEAEKEGIVQRRRNEFQAEFQRLTHGPTSR